MTNTDETSQSDFGRLKIALISDCYVPRLGGIEMQVHDLARQLQRAGHEVVVITTTGGPDVVDGVRVHRIDVPRRSAGRYSRGHHIALHLELRHPLLLGDEQDHEVGTVAGRTVGR